MRNGRIPMRVDVRRSVALLAIVCATALLPHPAHAQAASAIEDVWRREAE